MMILVLRIKIHKLVYKHDSASPEDSGHLQTLVSPRGGLSKNKITRLDFEKSAVCIGFVVIPQNSRTFVREFYFFTKRRELD